MIAHSSPCCVAAGLALDLLEAGSMPRRAPWASRFAAAFNVSKRPTTDPGRPPVLSTVHEARCAFPGGPHRSISSSGTYSASLLQRAQEGDVVGVEGLGEARIVQHGVIVGGPFHGRDVLEQQLRMLGQRDAVPHQHVAGARELAQLHAAVDERRRQRQDDQQ